jgi:hypothetical protein
VVARKDSLFCDVNGVGIIKIDLCSVINCSVPSIGKFAATEKNLVVGTMSTMLAGALILRRSFKSLVSVGVSPVVRMKTLDERVVVSSKGSWGDPAVEVVPVSLTADVIVPFMILSVRAVVDMDGLVACGVKCCDGQVWWDF